jgi:hypothetical protein
MEAVCRFCKEVPDGDRRCFLDAKRTRCSNPPCVIAYEQEYDRELVAEAKRRKAMRLMREQERARKGRRRYRRVA